MPIVRANRKQRSLIGGVLVFSAIALSGCNSVSNFSNAKLEGIGYREARFAEISVMRDYRKCRDDAFSLDKKAREDGSVARYAASAKLLESCEANLGPEAEKLAEEERMRAYALAIQNYFKAGEVVKARQSLEKFKSKFKNKDLNYANGSSFVETMEVLTGIKDRENISEFAMANVGNNLKSELRRIRYWKRN